MKRWINTKIEIQLLEAGFEVLSKEGFEYDGPLALATDPPVLEAADWAFYNDGTEAGSTIIGTKNTNQSLDTDTIYLFRQGLEETAANSARNQTMQLQYNHLGGGWNDVNATSLVVRSIATSNITDGDDTTQRITAFTHDPTNGGFDEVDGIAGDATADLNANGYEGLFAFEIRSADVSGDDTIVLKIVNEEAGGGDFDVYQQTNPTITVNAAAGAEIDRTIAEAFDVTDSPLRTVAATREFLEALGVNDAIIRGMLINRDLLETIDVNDIVEAWTLRGRVIAEETAVDDALFAYSAVSRLIAESLSVNDFLTTTVAGGLYSIIISEAIDANDFLLSTTERERLIQEAATTEDALTRSVANLRVILDNVEVVDTIVRIRRLTKVLVDTLDVSDVLRADVLGLMYTITLTDSVTAEDSLDRVAALSRLIIDSLDANDNILVNVSGQLISRIIAEGISVNDLISAGFFHNRILQDVVTAADAIIKTQQLGRTVTDSVDVDPFLIRTLIATRLFQENIQTTDQLVLTIARLLEVAIKALIDIETKDVVLNIDALPVELGIDVDVPAFGSNILATGNLVRATLTKAFLDDAASDVDDLYNNNYCYIPSGVAAGRKPRITDYEVSTVENRILYSRDPSNAAWTQGGPLELTQNAEGFYGEANKAWLINDPSTTALCQIWQTFTIPDDSNTHYIGVAVLKDTNESRFPGIQIDYFGGSVGISANRFQYNTETGDSIKVLGDGAAFVVDAGDWWIFGVALANNGTGNDTALLTFYPASGHVWGTYNLFTIGSCIADLFQARINTTEIGELIPTEDSVVEETVRVCSVDFDVIPNDAPVYQVLSNVGARS